MKRIAPATYPRDPKFFTDILGIKYNKKKYSSYKNHWFDIYLKKDSIKDDKITLHCPTGINRDISYFLYENKINYIYNALRSEAPPRDITLCIGGLGTAREFLIMERAYLLFKKKFNLDKKLNIKYVGVECDLNNIKQINNFFQDNQFDHSNCRIYNNCLVDKNIDTDINLVNMDELRDVRNGEVNLGNSKNNYSNTPNISLQQLFEDYSVIDIFSFDLQDVGEIDLVKNNINLINEKVKVLEITTSAENHSFFEAFFKNSNWRFLENVESNKIAKSKINPGLGKFTMIDGIIILRNDYLD